MALYTEISSNVLGDILAADEERRKKQRLNDYASQKAAVDNKYKTDNGGLGGFLSNLFRDAKSAANTVNTTFSALFGSPAATAINNFGMSNSKNNSQKNLDAIAQKYGYKNKDDAYDKGDGPEEMWKEFQDSTNKTRKEQDQISNDYKNNAFVKKINDTKQSQFGADALRTLKAGADVMGVGVTPVGNAIGGAVEGLADTLENANGTVFDVDARLDKNIRNSENATIDAGDALKNAAIGAAAGLATAGVNRKIGNATSGIGSRLLNNKLVTSGVGRGAIAGATGGAIGSGLGAATSGGDILGAALQGAGSGALTGGALGGVTSAGRKIGTSITDNLGVTDRIRDARNRVMLDTEPTQKVAKTEQKQTVTTNQANDLDIPDYTKPTDYQGNELKIEKKNPIQKLGNNLSKVGEKIDNAELYNALNSKTANKIVKNKTVQQLRKLGYNPEDYDEVAKISTTTNKFVDEIVKNSGASIVDNNLVDRLSKPDESKLPLNETLRKNYTQEIRKTIDALENNSVPGKYNAKDLLAESRRIGKIANKYYEQSKNANGGDNANERGILADALTDVKYELRDLASKSVDGFGDNYTKSQLAQRLKNLGANDKVVKDMLEAKNIGEMINKTAKYEDARQMAFEMQTNEYKRNAVSGSKSNANPVNRFLQDSGAGEIISVATRPAGKLVGKGAKLAGNVISGAGDMVSGKLPTISSTTTPTQPIPNNKANIYNIIGRQIGREEGYDAYNTGRKNQEFKSLEDQLSAAIQSDQAQSLENGLGSFNQVYGQQAQQNNQLDTIARAMDAALAAGDLQSYSKLADIYSTAYKIQETQNPTAKSTKLSDSQKKANTAAGLLDELEGMQSDFGYTVRDIPLLNMVNIGGNNYANTADALASELGYMLSGATIKDDELQKIKDEYIPQPFDSEAVRKAKLTRARNIIQQYQAGTTSDLS